MSDPLEIKLTVSVDENCNLRDDREKILAELRNDLFHKHRICGRIIGLEWKIAPSRTLGFKTHSQRRRRVSTLNKTCLQSVTISAICYQSLMPAPPGPHGKSGGSLPGAGRGGGSSHGKAPVWGALMAAAPQSHRAPAPRHMPGWRYISLLF